MFLSIYKLSVATLLLTGLLFASCDSKVYSAYQCPMKCEGDKTYPQEGKCPVCHMNLEGIETSK